MPPASQTTPVVDADFLAQAKRVAARTMTHVRSLIESIPDPMRTALQRLLQDYPALQQVNSVGQKLSLSVAHDLGIVEDDLLVRINNASTFGSLHSLVLDDFVDNDANPRQRPARNAYLAHLLFVFYINDLRLIHPLSWSGPGFAVFLASELETYPILFEEELQHVHTPTRFTDPVRQVAHKCSPAKAVLGQVLLLAGRNDIQTDLFRIVEDASFALCMIDDLLDWEEDLDRERYTYPIQRCFDELSINPAAMPITELKSALVTHLAFQPLYHELMKEATDKLYDCQIRSHTISHKLQLWLSMAREEAMQSWRTHVAFLCALVNRYRHLP